mgnify:CR=1 FL=1
MMQLALGLMWVSREIKKHDERKIYNVSIDNKAIMAVVLTSIAEFFCNHAMITGNHFSNVIEASLWTIALAILIPDSIRLYVVAKRVFSEKSNVDAI